MAAELGAPTPLPTELRDVLGMVGLRPVLEYALSRHHMRTKLLRLNRNCGGIHFVRLSGVVKADGFHRTRGRGRFGVLS